MALLGTALRLNPWVLLQDLSCLVYIFPEGNRASGRGNPLAPSQPESRIGTQAAHSLTSKLHTLTSPSETPLGQVSWNGPPTGALQGTGRLFFVSLCPPATLELSSGVSSQTRRRTEGSKRVTRVVCKGRVGT